MISLAAVISLPGCGDRQPPQSATGGREVVATYDGGRITVTDVDQLLLALPDPGLRMEITSSVERLEQLVRQLALQRLLVAEAIQRGSDRSPEFQRIENELLREVTIGLYLESHPLAPAPPTEAELESWYDDHTELWRRPERRMVYHIFLRFRPGISRDHLVADAAELRRRAVAGEPFPGLAAAHSDSELRHADGFMGVVERGQLPPDLEAVVFALEEGSPSEPITTRDGVHLFLVKAAVEEKDFSFEELRVQALRAVTAAKFEAAISEVIEELQPGVKDLDVDEEELRELLTGDDPEAPLLQVGEREITVSDLRALFARMVRLSGGRGPATPAAMLESLWKRELVYQRLVRDGLVDAGEVERRMERRVRDELSVWYLEERLAEYLAEQPHLLQEHYEANAMRFTNPLRLELLRLVVPLGADPVSVMARLEAAREALDAGDLELAALATELGGRVEDLGWVTVVELQRLEPRAVLFIDRLFPGQHSAPFSGRAGLQLLHLVDREAPLPLPYSEALGELRNDLLSNHQGELIAAFADQILRDSKLEIFSDRLQYLIETGFGAVSNSPGGENLP